MASGNMDERRGDKRIEVAMVAVVLARHNAATSMTIESLSLSGARLAGPGTFESNEHVHILFEIAGGPVEVLGEVVRVEHRDMTTDAIAVRFISLDDDHREAIGELVRRGLDLEEERLARELEDE